MNTFTVGYLAVLLLTRAGSRVLLVKYRMVLSFPISFVHNEWSGPSIRILPLSPNRLTRLQLCSRNHLQLQPSIIYDISHIFKISFYMTEISFYMTEISFYMTEISSNMSELLSKNPNMTEFPYHITEIPSDIQRHLCFCAYMCLLQLYFDILRTLTSF